jgi:ABC-type uncharacterized transport system YnjBCD substrate-binding protein
MYGGDERVNAYVREDVVPAARGLGITVRRVPVADTADAVQQVIAERRAGGKSGGSVDLIWINGENFASGKRAGLWLSDWARKLPNGRYVDWSDPSVATDFQVPVDGQESPWSRAAFVFARDPDRMPDAPADLDGLLPWARRHPGRFTYPAPPDFTGSAFVRQVVQAKGEDAAFAYLRELKPLMFGEGDVLPRSEAASTARTPRRRSTRRWRSCVSSAGRASTRSSSAARSRSSAPTTTPPRLRPCCATGASP